MAKKISSEQTLHIIMFSPFAAKNKTSPVAWTLSLLNLNLYFAAYVYTINPFTPELKKCILPTFQEAIVWVM